MTGLAGLAAAILFGAGDALWAFDQPRAGASVAQIMTFYSSASGRIIAGASLSLVSFVPFTVFASGLRAVLRDGDEDDDILATTAFAGGLLLVAAGVGAETINMVGALRAGAHQLSPALGQAVFEISYVLGYNAAGVGAGILLLATGAVGLRRRGTSVSAGTALFLAVGVAFLTPLSRFILAPGVLLLAVAAVQLLRVPTADLPPVRR